MPPSNASSKLQLAFRTEGEFINAYLESKGDAPYVLLVASLRLAMADPLVRAAWESTIEMAVIHLAERLTGHRVELTNRRFERSGGLA